MQPNESDPPPPDGPDEARINRNWTELIQELRSTQTGVQVLTGFLLTVPFTQGWSRVTEFQENLYFATLLCCAAATAFLITSFSLAVLSHKRAETIMPSTTAALSTNSAPVERTSGSSAG